MTDFELDQNLKELNKRKHILENYQKALLKTEEGQQFYKNNNRSLQIISTQARIANELEAKIQKNCPHPAWYFLKSFTNNQEKQTYWTCKCVACGKIMKEKRSGDFPHDRVIIGGNIYSSHDDVNLTYQEVADQYIEFIENNEDYNTTVERGCAFTKKINYLNNH